MKIDELKQYCNGEFGKIDRVRGELFSLYRSEKPEYSLVEKAAMASFLINIYGGVERILKQMLIFDKLDTGDAPEWHEKVLKKAGEIGILPPELFQSLTQFLAFRNYAIYSYIDSIHWEDMKALLHTVPDILSRLQAEVEEYIQTI